MPPQYRTRTRRGVVKEVGALNPETLGGSRWRGRSVCSRLASHFVRTTSARTPSSPLTTCCYSCCFGPEKSLYHISTPPSPSLLPYFFLIRSLSRASLGPFFLFPSSSSCCKLGCLPPPHTPPVLLPLPFSSCQPRPALSRPPLGEYYSAIRPGVEPSSTRRARWLAEGCAGMPVICKLHPALQL